MGRWVFGIASGPSQENSVCVPDVHPPPLPPKSKHVAEPLSVSASVGLVGTCFGLQGYR